jgi:hypothetical protein
MLHASASLSTSRRMPRGIAGACAAALLLGCATGRLWAQAQDLTAVPASQAASLQISSALVYGAYYSRGISSFANFQSGAPTLPYDVVAGASIRFDWTKFTDRSTFALGYTPSYTADVRYSSLDAFSHSFSLNVSRKLAPRWTFGFALAGNLSTLEESEFSPTTLSTVASTPATFSDLSSGLLSSQFANNPQLGIVLTNSPLLESPVSNLIYGLRMLTASAQTFLSYSFSPRLFITFRGSGNRMQHISQSRAITGNTYLLPTTTSVSAGVDLSYSLSPATRIGGSVLATRTVSALFDGYTTTSMLIWGRTLRQRWVLQTHGGMAVTNILSQGVLVLGGNTINSSILPRGPHPAFGGSLAYKIPAHTFLGSYDRTPIDNYGLGASTTSTSTAAWHWRPPGSSWWLDTAFSWQQMTATGSGQDASLQNTSGWRATAGLNRAAGTHAVLLTQYIYMNYSGGFQTSTYHFAESTVRVALAWTPHPATLR